MSKERALKNPQVDEMSDDLEKVLSTILKKINLAPDQHETFGTRDVEYPKKYTDKKSTMGGRHRLRFLFHLENKRRHKTQILKVLELAAKDDKILAQLAEDPAQVLNKFDLAAEDYAALASGDIKSIEKITGELTKKQKTWLNCRLQQEKW
ncbi:MAG: hypothetical protein GH144_05040 [Clostridia bacterium]|jgi:hypothetical protein|nr:hypothetical protein [Clostridia bacterium]